ncbi:acetylglutamate kinase [Anoxybacillus flavithermus]|uniref:Acetylglutamate kinase n=1 Tax=Anoxybacillus flavithermus (strain DSM 21510 / WK1) TaxID=491915 RepID=B7GM06_ANOFW|nr:acetylglutamate kinase [Anoxybacillus flavithermus]ACJ34509.1 Acetylglutamate kinase [Anoxybacillus flavithermus WK1]
MIVIKCGGSVLHELSPSFFTSVKQLRDSGLDVVIVHGGGPDIEQLLQALNIPSEFVNGLRKTTKDVLHVVEMVLNGKVNKTLVSLLQTNGIRAVGLSGVDDGLLQAKPIDVQTLGYVGEVAHVHAKIMHTLLRHGYVPVIAPIGVDEQGQTYNINADTAAAAIAQALSADKLVFVTDVAGILKNGKVVKEATAPMIETMMADGTISGGMIPKVKAALHALDSVQEVAIVSGKASFYNEGTWHGTMMKKEVYV